MDDNLEEEKQRMISTDKTLTIKMAFTYTNLFQNVKDQIIYEESSSSNLLSRGNRYTSRIVFARLPFLERSSSLLHTREHGRYSKQSY